MEDLTYSKDDYYDNDIITKIIDINIDSVSIVETEKGNFKIFCIDESCKIKIKAFLEMVKRGKNFIRTKCTKFRNSF